MKNFTDNFDKLAGFGTEGFEPVRQAANTFVDASEQLLRKNYEVYGDFIEFAVTQARLPLNLTDPKALFERQVNAGKAFADLMSARAAEYTEMGKSFQEAAADAANVDVAAKAAAPKRARTSRAKAA